MSHSFWYTDEEYVALISEVLGGIDLDPTTSVGANKRIGAKEIFTLENSCLEVDWPKVETCFMNPPYSSDCGTSKPFVQKFLKQFHKKRFKHGIVLVNASPASSWFQMLLRNCSMVCFPSSRIAFDEDVDFLWEQRYADLENPEDDLSSKEFKDYERVRQLLKTGTSIRTGESPRYDNAIFLFSHDLAAMYMKFVVTFRDVGTVLKKA